MNIIRFSDLCAQGKVQGQRVFIRADLNVPLSDTGEITEDTRVRASVPAIYRRSGQFALARLPGLGRLPLSAGKPRNYPRRPGRGHTRRRRTT